MIRGTDDPKIFARELSARWQNTEDLASKRAFELCEQYEIELVLRAMDALKNATRDKLVVDADRLAAVCLQLRNGGDHVAKRTADYISEQNAEGERSKALFRSVAAVAASATPEQRAEAVRRCERRYKNCWPSFKNQTQLIEAELFQMDREGVR